MGKWVKKKLGEIGDIITGSTPTTSKLDYWNGDYNFYSPADFTDNIYCDKTERTVTIEGLNVGRCIPENSIMVACIASIGKIAINKTKGITNQQINSIIPFDEFNYLFLYYLLLHKSSVIKNGAAQTTIPIINKEDFSNLEVTIPSSLSEQRRIASILSSADKVIDSTQKLIAKYKQIKQGMMEDLLKPKEGWKKVKLGECCEKITDGSHESPVAVLEGYYMPSVKDMSYSSFNFSNCKQISESDYLKLKGLGCKPEIGDVLIAKDGSILKYCFVMEDDLPIVILSSIAILKPNKQIMDSNFLSFYFQKRDVVIDVVENYKSGTGVPRIVLKNFEQIEITYPISLIEQRRIASILSSIDKKIESEEKVLYKYKDIKKGLMEKLLKEEEV